MQRRHELTDEQFKKIEGFLPGRKESVGVTAKDNRIFINGVIWIFKTGAPWRDLPERYGKWKNVHRRFSRWSRAGIFDKIFFHLPYRSGKWKNVHRRFSRWSRAGIFDKIFRVLSEDADMEFLLMDGTINKNS